MKLDNRTYWEGKAIKGGPRAQKNKPGFARRVILIRTHFTTRSYAIRRCSRMRTGTHLSLHAGHNDVDNMVVGVQWRLLVSVTRRESRKDWQRMASRVSCKSLKILFQCLC